MRSFAARSRQPAFLAALATLVATPVWPQPMQRARPADPAAAKALTPEFADAGDFYWHDGQRIALLRSNRELAVGFRPGLPQARIDTAVKALPRVDIRRARRGAPTGGKELWVLPMELGTSAAEVETTLAAARGRAETEYAHPVLYEPHTRARVMLTDDVVVKLKPGRTLADLASAMRSAGLAESSRLPGTTDEFILRLDQPRSVNPLAAAQRLHDSGLVAWAQPDFVQSYRRMAVPNDPRFVNQWHLNNTGQGGATVDADVDAPEAWNVSVGSSSIVIAVIDDGVERLHEDLSPNAYTNALEVVNGIDDDANTLVDDFRGWDFVGNDNDPNPGGVDDNHGTAVAGVAAGRGNNALGVAGSCQMCKIMPVRIGFGAFPDSHYANAIRYASTKADVLNNSWGGGTFSAVIQSAVQFAVTTGRGGKGSVVLFATGNSASGLVLNTVPGFPAGTHKIRWEYTKDGAVTGGSDTAWLPWVILPARVGFPNGELVTFQSGLPADWATGGDATWSVVTDPIHSDEGHCLTKTLKSGFVPANGFTAVEVVRTVLAGSNLYDFRWVSSEEGFDGVTVWIDLSNNGTWDFGFGLDSGEADFTNVVAYPAALPESIAVAATSDEDCRSYYSQYGPEVTIAASSNSGPINNAIETTDRMFGEGYEGTGNYTLFQGASGFGGTSSATPLASGIVGLVLSVKPSLKVNQVRAILKRSTDKVGPEPYVGPGGGRNNRYGYGRINAFKAVTAAAELIFENGFQ
jgi:subtilisin family serine protease